MINIDTHEHQYKLWPSGEVYQLSLLLKNRTVILQGKVRQVNIYIISVQNDTDIKWEKDKQQILEMVLYYTLVFVNHFLKEL